MSPESLFAITAAVVGGGLGALTLIGMLADYLQTRQPSDDFASRLSDGDSGSVPRGFIPQHSEGE